MLVAMSKTTRKRRVERRGESLPPLPRRGSRALAVLSALANEAVEITALFIAEAGPYAAGRRSPKWRYEMQSYQSDIDFEKILADWRERHRYSRAIAEIQRRRLARLVKRKGVLVLEITEEGKRRLLPLQNELQIPPQKHWDGKWRVVLFDIPEKYRSGRDILRERLLHLGFFPLQKSAFVFPYRCEDVIDQLLQRYHLDPHVTFFTAEDLGYHEAAALARFRLRRPKESKKTHR